MRDMIYIMALLLFVVPACVGIYEWVYSWLFDGLEEEEDWYNNQQ